MRLLDTNMFVRLITADEPEMTAAAQTQFERFERGEAQALVLDAVVAEVAYVLGSRRLYGLAREEIHERLGFLLSLPGVQVENRSRCLRALELYKEHAQLSFVDALIAAAALGEPEAEVYSFDRGFDGVAGLTRVEP